jgi:death on curing protein
MRQVSVAEIVELHRRILLQTRGAEGIRDPAALESAIAQPFQTFAGEALYPSLAAKAAALGFFIIRNHPFVDGNKRVGHAALEIMLVLNGSELAATTDEQEHVVLAVASGAMSREEFSEWVETHVSRAPNSP